MPIFCRKQKLLNGLFKIDVFLKNLNDEMLAEILLFSSDKYQDIVNKETLVQIPNALKGHCFLDCWYHFMTIFLISLHSSLFCKHDVVALLAPYQLLQIAISPLFLNNASKIFIGTKHAFVQHLTMSIVLCDVLCNVWISVILF